MPLAEQMRAKTPLVIDGSCLCHRAIHVFSKGNLLDHNGIPTEVIHSFFSQLFHIVEFTRTNFIIICWDSRKSYRRLDYPEYKGQRRKEKSEDEQVLMDRLYRQISILRLSLPKMGFMNSIVRTGLEADDLMHVTCRYFYDLFRLKSIMVTMDKDMYQTLAVCDILNPAKMTYFTHADFVNTYGIEPYQWPLAKAIGGCSSDNVIGIRGAADPAHSVKSKALAYIRGELTKGKIYDAIKSIQGQSTIKRNLPIVTLPHPRTEVPVFIDKPFELSKFMKIFDRYGLEFMKRDGNVEKMKKIFDM